MLSAASGGPEGKPASYWLRIFTMYMAFVHFAVGYRFFFASARTRRMFTEARLPFLGLVGVSVATGAAIYAYPLLGSAMYTLAFLHFAENALFQTRELDRAQSGQTSAAGDRPPPRAPEANVVMPLMLAFCVFRIGAHYVGEIRPSFGWLDLGVIGAFLLVLSSRTPASSARNAMDLAVQHWPLTLWLCAAAVFFRDGSVPFDLFILWHFATWMGFAWVHRPASRSALLRAHAVAAAAYGLLMWTGYLGGFTLPGWLLVVAVSPVAYAAQTNVHIVMALLFRSYDEDSERYRTVVRV